MMSGSSSPMPEQVETTHVVGIDIGMESCTMSCLTRDKRQVIKSTPFADTLQGFDWLFERLAGLGWLLSRSWWDWKRPRETRENLLQALLKRGYQVCLLHPAQMHAFAQQRGLRAKTDQLDAVTIARALPSRRSALRLCAERAGGDLSRTDALTKAARADDVARYKNEIHARLLVLFRE